MKLKKNNEVDLIIFLKEFMNLNKKKQLLVIKELERQKNDKFKSM